MVFTEWNTEEAKIVWKQEGREEGIEIGEKRGEKRGIKQGRKKTLLEMAKKLKIKGMSIPEIAEITQLTEEKIKEL